MLCDEKVHNPVVLHLIQHGHHMPIRKGKCNKETIEDQITIGLYSGQLPPMDQADVDWVCLLIDELIADYKRNPQEYRQS